MPELQGLIKQILNHDDLAVHVVGWLIAAISAMATMLYKGIWKARNLDRNDIDELQRNLDRLLGAHEAFHGKITWDGIERRKGIRDEPKSN